MNDQTRQKALRWFINFINADLGTLHISDKVKWTLEAVIVIDGMVSWRFDDTNAPGRPFSKRLKEKKGIDETLGDWKKNNKLEKCQKRLKEFFAIYVENAKAALKHASEDEKPFSELKNYFQLAQIRLQDLNIQAEMLVRPVGASIDDIFTEIIEDREVPTRITEEAILGSPVNLAFKAQTEEDTLLFYFLMALYSFPLGSIRACNECGKFFVHVSKKKKMFCSSNCAVRKANRDRRKRIKDSEPEKYKKERDKGKKRSAKSYKQRMEKKLGKKVQVGKKL